MKPPARSRRPAAAACATLALFALACGADAPAGPDPGPDPDPRPAWPAGFLVGGDISALARLEQGGAVYSIGGTHVSAITALRTVGANTFRLRLFVDPSGDEVQVNDLPYTVELARRVKASGATFILDFHYSDTWADPGHQVTPAAWQSLDIDALEDTVQAYTARALAALDAAGARPDIVQIGNEIDAGLLWPLGRIGGAGYDQPENFERFGRLLKAGVRGVEAALGPDGARVMIHYSQGANIGGMRWFFDHVEAQGVDYDMIGLSYYPWWHGSLLNLANNLRQAADRYGRDVVVVETSYPWRDDWNPSGGNGAYMNWAETPAGQAAFLRALADTVAASPRGKGVVWWYPESVRVPGLFVWGGGTLALFDASGALLPAAREFAGP